MNAGEIAAICIAVVSVIALSVLLWIARRKRQASRDTERSSAGGGAEDGNHNAQSEPPEPAISISTTPPAHQDTHLSLPGLAEPMDEKRDMLSGYSDNGDAASSPGSSSAHSSLPLLSPGPITPTDAHSPMVQMRPLRITSWDDPPPTPDFRPELAVRRIPGERRRQEGVGHTGPAPGVQSLLNQKNNGCLVT
ncbi:hypothetical protein C8Q77DRAFT_751652 [Trametes polyzona]|nr:hypothetical protein C8Q77DRAFT_751652 [Trametes polyzona]